MVGEIYACMRMQSRFWDERREKNELKSCTKSRLATIFSSGEENSRIHPVEANLTLR